MFFASTVGNTTTLQGNEVVVKIGRLATGTEQSVSSPVVVSSESRVRIEASASVTSATALPSFTNSVTSVVVH
ncbi:hypothetical protein H7849_08135 [Alloacidobacterium dinghuense]|uniref:Uncharacterized protein n=1 Tax=Alloacidobacterium dinghuense TaxID=2763107 RepID=A0A7G8BRQ4_9BACT|nr:hypothetical protein [Alloacidobacterium dinghuense]QNI35224.1 hypothetical protein H7849_08135 [Alloacidobacterium dinghuense]